MAMSPKSSSKVKSTSVPEPSVLIAVTPKMLCDLQLNMPSHEWHDWGRVSSEFFQIHSPQAEMPSRKKKFKVMLLRPPADEISALGSKSTTSSPNEDLLSAEAISIRMECTRANVYEREKRGHLFSVLPPGRENGRKYPAFQIHPNIESQLLVALISLYRNSDSSMNLLWDFVRSVQPAFGGLTGAELLINEHPDRPGIKTATLKAISALSCAERCRFVVDHALEDLHHASA